MLLQGVALGQLLEPLAVVLQQMAVKIVRRVVDEGASGQQHERHHSEGPHVHREAVNCLVVEDLRGQIPVRAHQRHHPPRPVSSPWRRLSQLQLRRAGAYGRAAEIDELDDPQVGGSFVCRVSSKHEVLEFHISVHRIQIVDNGDRPNTLPHDPLRLLLGHSTNWVVRQEIQQVRAGEQLSDDVDVLGILEEFLVLQNVG
mmetsp:Transcript_31300/g.74986  ORF Transcript_31300/g.74986 Transcript_31300/m.74986 type:complete len:200 (+) Transcript_31300:339-938(+)